MGSFDDASDDDQDSAPVLCAECQKEVTYIPGGGIIIPEMADLRICPKCDDEGCKHWCDGIVPCDWCVNGRPPDAEDRYTSKREED